MKKCLTILLSFLLTGAIVLFCVSFSAQQAIAPAMGEEGAPVDDGTIREQEEIIRARVAELGELYGFSTEPVMEMIDEGILRDLNEQASGWWSALLKDGKPGDEPEWDTEDLEYVLYAELYTDEAGAEATQELTLGVLEEVRRSVLRTVLPMRHKIVELGMQKVGKRVDVPNPVAFFMGVPWAVLALCALTVVLGAFAAAFIIRGTRHNQDAEALAVTYSTLVPEATAVPEALPEATAESSGAKAESSSRIVPMRKRNMPLFQ